MRSVQERIFDVVGVRVLITGAAGGIGLAFTEALGEAGARVVMVDRDEDALVAQAAKLKGCGASVHPIVADLSKEAEVDDAFRVAHSEIGPLDIVFANAGITGGRGFAWSDDGQLAKVELDSWHRVLNVNLTSVMLTMRASARVMVPRRAGRIVVTSSVSGLRAEPMVAYSYVATKAAVVALVRQSAIELARHQVKVTAIAPGPFATNIAGGKPHDPASRQLWLDRVPLRRVGNPVELKGLALLLASPAADFMTGDVITVDGGLAAGNAEW